MRGASQRRSGQWLNALLGLLIAASALAFTPRARADEDAEYQDLINRALVEYQGGRWEESRSLFERAHARKPSARTLRGIALASFEMRDYVRCVIALRGALDSQERKLDPTQRKQAQDLLAQAEDYVAHRTLALSPANATVKIDGEDAQLDDGKLLLNPGTHELVAEAPGYQPLRMSIVARSGSEGPLEMQLSRGSAASAGSATMTPAAARTTPTTAVPADHTSESSSILPIALIAGGGALIVGAGVTAAISLHAKSELEDACGADHHCPPSSAADKSRGNTTQTLTWILAPVGVVGLALGIVLTQTGADERAPVALGCGPDGCFAQARASF